MEHLKVPERNIIWTIYVITLTPSVNIVSFDEKAAFVYGQIRADLEKAGKIINHTDLQIAAITMSNKYILITGNIRHFKRISNLRVENWI